MARAKVGSSSARASRPSPAESELRQRILTAGESVFASAGYAGATVDDVIKAAQTSRASFYRYFKSKDDLFRELSLECFREMREVIRQFGTVATADPAATHDQLVAAVAAYRDLHGRHGGVIRAWTERAAPPDSPIRAQASEVFDALLGEMERALRAAGTRTGGDTEVQAALMFLAIERSSFFVSNRHSRVDPDRLAPTLGTMLHRAYFGGEPSARKRKLRIAGR
ncbi:MAG TPA: TetR/AcrR family transcriptional regulator [Acidimicrobiales bacterium]|nr:TetR/AcrR family transcriptional regulator [Acidimicrobiales bacterium]